MKNNLKVLIGSIVVLLILFVISFEIKEEKIFPATFYLSEKAGFDFTDGYISFGKITQNQSATRTVQIDNNYDKRVKITIESSKEIASNIIASENNFYLEPFESKNVTFTVFTDGLEEFRKYEGNITIISKRKLI